MRIITRIQERRFRGLDRPPFEKAPLASAVRASEPALVVAAVPMATPAPHPEIRLISSEQTIGQQAKSTKLHHFRWLIILGLGMVLGAAVMAFLLLILRM
jgi:hypothetical protein